MTDFVDNMPLRPTKTVVSTKSSGQSSLDQPRGQSRLRRVAVSPRSYRRPHHAGTWYEDNGSRLASRIQDWLDQVTLSEDDTHAQAIIAPHAGYQYCGHVMAQAYSRVDKSRVDRVFLFGPSHHYYTDGCALSPAEAYRTPLGDLKIDDEVYAVLKDSGLFEVMDLSVDEAEHSLELHTPYIQFMLSGKSYKLVPIMIGVLTAEMETVFGRALNGYLDDPSNLFVISSDFCHWGSRFRYTPYDVSMGPIWKYIEWLDREGIEAIESGNPGEFRNYLQKTGNTICGRYPICLFLNMLQHCVSDFEISFLFYDQSAKCYAPDDSSVSYAAAVVTQRTFKA